MAGRLSHPRVRVGGAVRLVAEDAEGVELEGPLRLAPGRPVEVVVEGPTVRVRLAIVWSCQLISMGKGLPRYRGYCRWS